MSSTGKQRAENTPPEEQIANALGREAVDWLKQKCVLQPLSQLVVLGCDPQELWDGLTAIALASWMDDPRREEIHVAAESKHAEPEHAVVLFPRKTFDGEMGFDRSELETVIKRLRQCADDVARLPIHSVTRLLRERFGLPPQDGRWFPPVEGRPTLGDCLAELSQLMSYQAMLPWRLRLLALAGETAAESISFPDRSIYDSAAASLVAYVRRITGRACDVEISALIEAVRGTAYDAEAHSRWRKRHSKSSS